MNSNRQSHRKSILYFSIGMVVGLLNSPSQANDTPPTKSDLDWTQASGALEALGLRPNDSSFMKSLGLKVGGWIETSISTQLTDSTDKFNGIVGFNDRADELQMNQFYLWLQRPVTISGDKFDFGGRFDFLYGTDAIFTQAYGVIAGPGVNRGNWDLNLTHNFLYNIALPQAYLEFNLPFGNGIDLKIGHFYSPVGYEVVTAPDNFFVTKSTTFIYDEPFTHVGILGAYSFTPNWAIKAGAVTGSSSGGWDGSWNRQLGNWAFLGGITWTSDNAQSSLGVTSTVGYQAERHQDLWAVYSIVGTHNFSDRLHYVIQHDHAFADNIVTPYNAVFRNGQAGNVRMYGINQYLLYDVNSKFSVGLRAEWWRDETGVRIFDQLRCSNGFTGVTSYTCTTGAIPNPGGHFYTATFGLNYKPLKWLILRPNLRYDYATTNAFNRGQSRDQVLFTADMVVSF